MKTTIRTPNGETYEVPDNAKPAHIKTMAKLMAADQERYSRHFNLVEDMDDDKRWEMRMTFVVGSRSAWPCRYGSSNARGYSHAA